MIKFLKYFFLLFSILGCLACAKQSLTKFTPGFKETDYLQDHKPKSNFPESEHRCDLSELNSSKDNPPHLSPQSLILTPQSNFRSWKHCFMSNPEINCFLVTPGDYRKWGMLSSQQSGRKGQRKIIRYYDPDSSTPYNPPHPVIMADSKGREAILEGFGLYENSNWIIHGLSFRGTSQTVDGKTGGPYNYLRYGAHNNIISFCLIEEVLLSNAIRIETSNNNCIQDCVIRNKIEGFTGDNIGVSIDAIEGKESRGNRIIDNEIYNYTDGVQLIYQVKMGKNSPLTGDVPGTIIENNDIYITKELYTTKDNKELACAENGIDIKVGTKSSKKEDRILVLKNRIWGFRITDNSCSGASWGDAIMIHRNSSNIFIKDNIIFDVSRGISVAGKHHKTPKEFVSNVAIVNNLFFDFKIDNEDQNGWAFVTTSGVDVYYNTVFNAAGLVAIGSDTASNRFQCNTFINIKKATPWTTNKNAWSNMNAWINYPDTKRIYSHQGSQNYIGKINALNEFKDFSFYIKRWTNPKMITARNVIPGKKIVVPGAKGCNCVSGGEGDRWWND